MTMQLPFELTDERIERMLEAEAGDRSPAGLTIDIMSGGRLELGIGAGWNTEESDAYGLPLGTPRERSDRFEEACEVLVSLPYEPGRAAFASLSRTADDLGALADGRVEELGPRGSEYAHPALAQLSGPPPTQPFGLLGHLKT